MSQIEFRIKGGIQDKAIELLQREDISFEGMFGFALMKGKIEPMMMFSDTVKDKEAFQKEFYELLDRHLDFNKVREMGVEKFIERRKK